MAAQTAPTRAITLEEFEAKYAGKRYEYVNGCAVPMGPEIVGHDGTVVVSQIKPEHGLLTAELIFHIGAFAREHKLGSVFGAEAGFIMREDTQDIRAADLAFISAARMSEVRIREWLPFPPDLAVEVVS